MTTSKTISDPVYHNYHSKTSSDTVCHKYHKSNYI